MRTILSWLAIALMFLVGVTATVYTSKAAEVTLAWDPNPETDLAGYKLYRTSESTNTVITELPVSPQLYTETNLLFGVEYTWALTAFNIDGLESDFSETVSKMQLKGVPPVPEITTNSLSRNGTTWTINLAWKPISKEYGPVTFSLRVLQGETVKQNLSTTNTLLTVTTPVFSPTFIHLWSSNALGESSPVILQRVKPGAPQGLRTSN